jgi:hypothetical protein
MKEDLQTKFDNFEGRYDFSATEWTGLEQRLNRRDLWRRAILALLGSLLLLGLVGSNIVLWRQNQALNQRFSTFDAPTTATEKAASTTVLAQTDTIIKRTVIYQYDTIYRKITIVEQPYLIRNYQNTTTNDVPISTIETTGSTTSKAGATRNTQQGVLQNDPLSISQTPTAVVTENAPQGIPNVVTTSKTIATGNARQGTPNVSTTETTGKATQAAPNISTTSQTVPPTNLDNNHITNASDNRQNATNAPPPDGIGTGQYPSEKMDKKSHNSRENKAKQTISGTTDSLNTESSSAKSSELAVEDSTASKPIVAEKKTVTKDSITLKMPPFDSLAIVKNDKKGEDKEGKKHPKYTFKMLPIYVGATLGLPIWAKTSAISQTGNQYGLKVEAVATEHVRFFAEMNYAKNGESKSTSIATVPNEISLPTVDSKFSFKYWEASGVQSLNYILGAQYQWNKFDKFHPYIAAAFNGTTTLPFEVDFEYIDSMTGAEKSFKQQTKLFSHLNRIYGAVGVHWSAFPNGQLSAETYVTTPVGNDKDLIPTQVGLKIGVFYFIK